MNNERHWIVTTVLILAILIAIKDVFKISTDQEAFGSELGDLASGLVLTVVIRITGYVALLYGKKLGFYLIVIMTIVDVFMGIFGTPENAKDGFEGIMLLLFGVVGIIRIGIIYGILQIKKNNISAWNNLSKLNL